MGGFTLTTQREEDEGNLPGLGFELLFSLFSGLVICPVKINGTKHHSSNTKGHFGSHRAKNMTGGLLGDLSVRVNEWASCDGLVTSPECIPTSGESCRS